MCVRSNFSAVGQIRLIRLWNAGFPVHLRCIDSANSRLAVVLVKNYPNLPSPSTLKALPQRPKSRMLREFDYTNPAQKILAVKI